MRARDLTEDIDEVRDALDSLDVYDLELAAGVEDAAARARLQSNRNALAEALAAVADRGYVGELERIVFKRHARITQTAGAIPSRLLPNSLPEYKETWVTYELRKARWRRRVEALDQQRADREAWCALHGVEDPVDMVGWYPDEPWDGIEDL